MNFFENYENGAISKTLDFIRVGWKKKDLIATYAGATLSSLLKRSCLILMFSMMASMTRSDEPTALSASVTMLMLPKMEFTNSVPP